MKDLLARAAEYVQQFQRQFGAVISLETYEQHDEQRREAMPRAWLSVSSEARTLRSEMLFTWLPTERSWLAVRNVLAVDGESVADSADRLDRALSETGSRRLLRLLADEGARFNLGRIRRNVNDPTLVLRFLDAASQSRFKFSLAGREQVKGVDSWMLTFRERETPALVRNARGDDLFASGSIWLAVADSAVVRTSLALNDKRARLEATTLVDYQRELKLAMWVPSQMVESYVQQVGKVEERITCTATYSDYRRFETSGRLLSQ